MSLSGNLGFVPIDEVLRLLTRSKQQGAVEVSGDGLAGRVFVGKGGIDLATTWGDSDLHRHLLNSGFSDEASLRRVTSGETTLAAIADANLPMIDLIREMTVESLYQIGHRGDEFRVQEGVTTPYASPKSFELEALLEDAKDRERDWDKVTEVVPDLTGAISFRRDLGEREEVTVKVDDWKVLSEIGTGASVTQIADHLGTTEFWTARVAARLVKNDLIVLSSGAVAAEPATLEVPAPQPDDPRDDEAESEPVTDADQSEDDHYESPGYSDGEYEYEEAAEDVAEIEVPATDVPVTEVPALAGDVSLPGAEASVGPEAEVDGTVAEADHNESWWQEPTDEGDEAGEEPPTPEVVAEGLSEIPSVDSDVEGDTEAFLEKVFSELESSEPEADEGHGLLRRRRMGSLRDFSSDS